MPCPALIRVLAAGLLILALTTCTPSSPPSATAVVATRQTAAKARHIQARIAGLHTLAALLTITFANPVRRDTFDMIVNYDAAGKIRYTAFKDLMLSSRPIFDLLFIRDHYDLTTHDAGHARHDQGPIAQFATAHPSMRIFALVGEAFFLPGYDAAGRPPIPLNTAGTRFRSRLKSGLQAVWATRPERPEIVRAQIDGKVAATPVSLQLTYHVYRRVAAYTMPVHVTLRDPSQRLTTQAWVKQIEINTPLAAGVFDVSARPSPSTLLDARFIPSPRGVEGSGSYSGRNPFPPWRGKVGMGGGERNDEGA